MDKSKLITPDAPVANPIIVPNGVATPLAGVPPAAVYVEPLTAYAVVMTELGQSSVVKPVRVVIHPNNKKFYLLEPLELDVTQGKRAQVCFAKFKDGDEPLGVVPVVSNVGRGFTVRLQPSSRQVIRNAGLRVEGKAEK